MESKLLCLLMDLETFNLIACVRTGQRCNQSSLNTNDGTFSKDS